MSDPFEASLAARFRVRARADGVRLRDALARSDRPTVEAIAHALSGTAGTFGFGAIGDHAAALELAAEAGGERWAEAAQPLLAALDGI